MNKDLPLVIAIAFLLIFSSAHASEDIAWLQGNWLLTYDPDGDTQDKLTFGNSNKFTTTEVSSGKQLKGTYEVSSESINVNLFFEGKSFMEFDLRYDDKKNKLYYVSDDAGSESHYTKID